MGLVTRERAPMIVDKTWSQQFADSHCGGRKAWLDGPECAEHDQCACLGPQEVPLHNRCNEARQSRLQNGAEVYEHEQLKHHTDDKC